MCAKCVWPPLCVYIHVYVDWKSIKTSRIGVTDAWELNVGLYRAAAPALWIYLLIQYFKSICKIIACNSVNAFEDILNLEIGAEICPFHTNVFIHGYDKAVEVLVLK